MPRPERYVSRSDLGWGESNASIADPKEGLVIHYDGSNQRLAQKPHSACVDYWRDTRNFHTGSSRNWADIGYCVDEETEILTTEGWKTHRRVRPGDTALTLNHETGLAEWQPITDVYVFPALPRTMVRMEGRFHSSLTTPQHRWPVERLHRHPSPGPTGTPDSVHTPRDMRERERTWATTRTLTRWDRIPHAAPCVDLPTEAKWSDALVELVAWLCSQGHTEPRPPDTDVILRPGEGIGAARVRAALHTLFGPPGGWAARPGRPTRAPHRWRERPGRNPAELHLSADAGRVLLEHAPDRVVRLDFLRSLTRAQLDLFVEVSLLATGGDGGAADGRSLVQSDRGRAEAFQFAAVLAGYATSLHLREPVGAARTETWVVRLRTSPGFSPGAATARDGTPAVTEEHHEGRVWCVRTPNATWLARRAGTVYFTGNSFGACPHGYVFEGRGLYRVQAAQPGGNSTFYSVTLMSGPDDEITDEQVNAVRQLREWLMEPNSSIGGTVRGHRDFVATTCPGDRAYRLVSDGVFNKPARWEISSPGEEEEDVVPHYLNMAQTKEIVVSPRKHASLRWDTVWTDTAETAHRDGLAVITKPCDLNGALWLDIAGLGEADDVQVRMADWERATGKYHLHPIAEGIGTEGRTFPAIPVINRLAEGRTMDLRVYNVGSYPFTVRRATFKGHVWLH